MTTAEGRPEVDWAAVEWKRASRCSDCACVEVARIGADIAIRDTKHAGLAPLVFTKDEWKVFVAGVKQGDFDVD